MWSNSTEIVERQSQLLHCKGREKEAEKGKVNPFNILMPNLGEKSRQEAITSTAGDSVAEPARQSVQAGRDAASSSSANPSAKAPPFGETQRTKKQKR